LTNPSQMNDRLKYNDLGIWTPASYHGKGLSRRQIAINYCENYFYLGGRKSQIIKTNGRAIEVTTPQLAKQEWFITVLKVSSYSTIFLPGIFLLGKAIFRWQHTLKFEVKPVKTNISEQSTSKKMPPLDPHFEAKNFRAKLLAGGKEQLKTEGEWQKFKFNTHKSKEYLYSLQENGQLRIQHIEKRLGKGGFGKVKLLHDIDTGKRTALKIADPVKDPKGEILVKEAEKLARIYTKTQSELIQKPPLSNVITIQSTSRGNESKVKALKAFETIAFEGSLEQLLKKTLPLPIKIEIINQIAHGVKELHSNGIFHGDLKPSNILYKKRNLSYVIQIIDLAGAVFESSQHKGIQFTSRFTDKIEMKNAFNAPLEVNFDALKLLDIRALGITFFNILTGQYPNQKNKSEMTTTLNEECYHPLRKMIIGMIGEEVEVKKAIFSGASDTFKSLIRNVGFNELVDSSIKTKRPSIEEICKVTHSLIC